VQINPWAPFVVQPATGCDEIKRQYRLLARSNHPDHGGNHAAMARVNDLYRELLRLHA